MHLSVGVGNARADRCGPLAWWLELSELDATNAASSSRVATVTAADLAHYIYSVCAVSSPTTMGK